MSSVQDQLEIKFRLTDGWDIGPKSFPAATSGSTLKESILSQWPKGAKMAMKLFSHIPNFFLSIIQKKKELINVCTDPELLVAIIGNVKSLRCKAYTTEAEAKEREKSKQTSELIPVYDSKIFT